VPLGPDHTLNSGPEDLGSMPGSSISTEYTRGDIGVVFLENDHLRVEVLAGTGGDITKLRDNRTDTDLLFEVPYE
jgi:hypothetical protein